MNTAYYPFERAICLAKSRAKATGKAKFLYLCKAGETAGMFYIKSEPWSRYATHVQATHKIDTSGNVFEIQTPSGKQ